MIEKLLICMILVKFCNADSGNYNSCKNEGGQLFGPGNTLCNPRLTVGTNMFAILWWGFKISTGTLQSQSLISMNTFF